MKSPQSDLFLQKLGISALNKMQHDAYQSISSGKNTLVLSPTGSGKTIGFLLPCLELLDNSLDEIQLLILAPSRELAMQIEQVAKSFGAGFKINSVYGGQRIYKDQENLSHTPQILVGTPGRVLDHLKRNNIELKQLKCVILDEYDKSLEIGFEKDMQSIFQYIPSKTQKILTSATQMQEIPVFVGAENLDVLDFLELENNYLQIEKITSPHKDKLECLAKSLKSLQGKKGIVFANYKQSIQRISDFLQEQQISHGIYYGGLEQNERERVLVKFRNGTIQTLLATDLAARGLDLDGLDYILHYHLPLREEEFVHRNGRTARMKKDGTAYVMTWEKEELPEFINPYLQEAVLQGRKVDQHLSTIFISGGRRDKVSKADIAGLFYKKGNLDKGELGHIELLPECAFIAVPAKKAKSVVKALNNQRIKKRKLRVYEV